MSAGKHKTVAVVPVRVSGIVLEQAGPQDVRHGRTAHGQARVSAIRFLNRVHGQEANGINA